MGNRLSKIYTRTGDVGTTGLGDGSRTDKDSLRIHVIGDIDELNACIGLLLSEKLPDAARAALEGVQHDLFDLGGELCIPGSSTLTDAPAKNLEALLDQFNADMPPLKEFILPGGSRAASAAHLARTVCRRAERWLVTLGKAETVSVAARQYLNRLSDLLFVLSRIFNRESRCGDVLWQPGRSGK